YGFTGKVAAKFKEDYIIAFNEMEALLHSEECTKVANKMLGDEVKRLNKRLRSAVREGQVKYGKYYGPYGDIQSGLFHSDKLSFRDNLTNLCGMVHSAFLDGYFVAKEMRESKGLLSQFREFLSRIY
ncbi:MAG: Rha family transcriptional regulator, partial [Duncaniella sp.]|nr:Rha family transcriptional regulator [Duncaniella sp.]